MVRSARRWARVAVRWVRPTLIGTPSSPRITGVMNPLHKGAADGLGWDGDAVTGLTHAVRVQPTGRGGLGIHDVGHVGFEGPFAVVAAGDESAECFGGEPVALVAPLEELGVTGAFTGCDHRRDLAVDGVEDLVGELGVERKRPSVMPVARLILRRR
jgi:hypothetical protein